MSEGWGSGWDNQVVSQVIIVGPGGQLLIYSPVEAAGDLIAAISGANGADSLGDPYLQGIGSYVTGGGNTVGTVLNGAQLQGFYNTGSALSNWFIGQYVATTGGIVTAKSLLGLNASTGVYLGSSTNNTQGVIYVFPSGDTTGVTDLANITNALAITGLVMLPTGRYYVDGPIVLPDQSALICPNPSWGIPTGNYGAGSLPLQGAIITAVSGFSGGQVISMGSAGTSQHGGQRLYGITIDGHLLPAANTVNGIESVGYVGGVKMRDVVVWGGYNTGTTTGLGGHGLYAHNDGTSGHNPDFWEVDASKFSACGGYGMEIIAMSDSWFINGEATGNNTGGGNVQNCGETRFIGWRFNNNNTSGTTPGLAYTGLTGFTGTIVFDTCDFSANGVGIAVSGAGTGVLSLANVVANSNTTAFTYAGSMSVTGLSMLNQPAAPSQVAGYALPFATGGNLAVVSGNDGNTYDTEVLHLAVSPAFSVTATGFPNPVTSATVPVGIGHYRFTCEIIATTAAAVGTPQLQFTFPSATGRMKQTYTLLGGGNAQSNQNTFSAATSLSLAVGPALNGAGFDCIWSGDFTTTAAGNLALGAITSNAADAYTVAAVWLDLYPVN